MRSLFQRAEKAQYVFTPPTTQAEEVATQKQTEETVMTAGKPVRKQKSKKVLSLQEQHVRNRRRAGITLAVSLAVGARWFVANQAPTYPVGKGVYAKDTAPEWGKMKQPNAATFYMAATDALDMKAIFANKPGNGTLYILEQPASVQKPYVEKAQPAFALLRQGMKYPYVRDFQTNYFKSDPNVARGISRPVPNFITQREMARLLAAEANVRASEGNQVGAMESSLDAVRLGVDESKGRSLIEGMIGILIEGIGVKEGVKHVAGLTAPEARAAASRLEGILATKPAFPEIMTQERQMLYETMQTVFQQGSAGELIAATNGDSGQMLQSAAGKIAYGAVLMYYTKQGIVNDYASQMDQILAREKMP